MGQNRCSVAVTLVLRSNSSRAGAGRDVSQGPPGYNRRTIGSIEELEQEGGGLASAVRPLGQCSGDGEVRKC